METRDLAVENNDPNFSGTETYTADLKVGDKVTIDTRGNVFDYTLVDEAGTELVTIEINGTFGTDIKKDGKYTMTVSGKGEFKLTWGNVDNSLEILKK